MNIPKVIFTLFSQYFWVLAIISVLIAAFRGEIKVSGTFIN